jgi:hypothetical protein
MLSIYKPHEQITEQIQDCPLTTRMGLGLVRLLMDAGRTREAEETLSLLGRDEAEHPINRLKGRSGRQSFWATGKAESITRGK